MVNLTEEPAQVTFTNHPRNHLNAGCQESFNFLVPFHDAY